jgi:MFS family permease
MGELLLPHMFVQDGSSVADEGIPRFTATVPTVILQLGYSAANAQLLTIPIYVCGVLLVLLVAFWSDRVQVRWIFIVGAYSIAIMGFIAQLAIPHPAYPGVTYGFLFPVCAGLYGGFPPMLSWMANNLAPSSKRAVGMALLISVGNMGGIMGSNIYLANEAPKYQTGFGVSLAMLCLGITSACILRWAYARANEQHEQELAELGEDGVRAKYSAQELLDMGDRSPFFRYAL